MHNFLNWRVKVVLSDGVIIIGKFMATDMYFNLVLADSEEIRQIKSKAKGLPYFFF